MTIRRGIVLVVYLITGYVLGYMIGQVLTPAEHDRPLGANRRSWFLSGKPTFAGPLCRQ